MGSFIKYNKNLLHLDLSYCRLSRHVIHELGTPLRRAKALLCIHLSGNDIEEEKAYLKERIKCKTSSEQADGQHTQYSQEEGKERQLRNTASQYFLPAMQSPRESLLVEGLQLKNIMKKKKVRASLDPVETFDSGKLIFSRVLGHFTDLPGSGQWVDAPQCWICEKWIYSFIFWSQSIGYALSLDVPDTQPLSVPEGSH